MYRTLSPLISLALLLPLAVHAQLAPTANLTDVQKFRYLYCMGENKCGEATPCADSCINTAKGEVQSQTPKVTAEKPEAYPVSIVSITGDIVIRIPGGQWQELASGSGIAADAEVHTGPESILVIKFKDGSTTTLKEFTQVRIGVLLDKKDRQKVELLLKFGELRAHVKPRETIRSDFSVRTPTAVASVRGTLFSVKYVEKTETMSVAVAEGSVNVAPQDKKKKEMLVKAGYKLTAPRKGVLKTAKLSKKETAALKMPVEKIENIR